MKYSKDLNSYNKFKNERAYNSADYKKLVEKYAPLLNEQTFTIKQVKKCIKDITYRKINDWESKGIFTVNREKKGIGWRKFSIIDILKLFIISDLKRFGLDYKKIVTIIDRISNDTVRTKNNNIVEDKFLKLEYNFFSCGIKYHKIYLMIDCYNHHLFEKIAIIADCLNTMYLSPKIIILPFFYYIQTIFTELLNMSRNYVSESFYLDLLNLRLNNKEKEILQLIREKNYQEIFIKRINNNEFKIKTKIRKNGLISDKDIMNLINSKDYQNVTVITENGKKISIIQEIRQKI